MKFFYEDRNGRPFQINYGERLAFDAHLHDHIEMVGMIRGKARAYVDSRAYEIKAGDVVIVFPNQIHRYEKIDEEFYMIFIFPPELIEDFTEIFRTKIPESAVVPQMMKDACIQYGMERIMELFGMQGLGDSSKDRAAQFRAMYRRQASLEILPFQRTEIKGNFLIILSRLFAQMKLISFNQAESQSIQMILNYCTAHVHEPLLLEQVAKILHLSKYYISHLFSEKLHMTYGTYIHTLKITEAAKLLEKSDYSVTEVAFASGFNSMRTFNRVFKKYTGVTPQDYRKTVR